MPSSFGSKISIAGHQGVVVGTNPTIMLWTNGHYRIEIDNVVYFWVLDHFSEDMSTVFWKTHDGEFRPMLISDYEKTWRIKTT